MLKAIKYATKKHEGQKRMCGEAYINHPLRVMEKVKTVGLGKDFQKVAVLHDVIEDCSISREYLEEVFSFEIAEMVYFLSKEPKNNFKHPNERKIKYLETLDKGIKKYNEILIIKMCDQLDNLDSINLFEFEKFERIISEIKDDFIPLYLNNIKFLSNELKLIFLDLYIEFLFKLRENSISSNKTKDLESCSLTK